MLLFPGRFYMWIESDLLSEKSLLLMCIENSLQKRRKKKIRNFLITAFLKSSNHQMAIVNMMTSCGQLLSMSCTSLHEISFFSTFLVTETICFLWNQDMASKKLCYMTYCEVWPWKQITPPPKKKKEEEENFQHKMNGELSTMWSLLSNIS